MIPMAALADVVGNAGLRFPLGDDEALARCLERVLSSSEYAATGRQRAQERAWWGGIWLCIEN